MTADTQQLNLSHLSRYLIEASFDTGEIKFEGADAPLTLTCRIRVELPGGAVALLSPRRLKKLADFHSTTIQLAFPSTEWELLKQYNWKLIIPSVVDEHLRGLKHPRIAEIYRQFPSQIHTIGQAWRATTLFKYGRPVIQVTRLECGTQTTWIDDYLTMASRLLTGSWEGLWLDAGDGFDWECGLNLLADYLRMRWFTGKLPPHVQWAFRNSVFARRPFPHSCPSLLITLQETSHDWHPTVEARITGLDQPFVLPPADERIPLHVMRLLLQEIERTGILRNVLVTSDQYGNSNWQLH